MLGNDSYDSNDEDKQEGVVPVARLSIVQEGLRGNDKRYLTADKRDKHWTNVCDSSNDVLKLSDVTITDQSKHQMDFVPSFRLKSEQKSIPNRLK